MPKAVNSRTVRLGVNVFDVSGVRLESQIRVQSDTIEAIPITAVTKGNDNRKPICSRSKYRIGCCSCCNLSLPFWSYISHIADVMVYFSVSSQ